MFRLDALNPAREASKSKHLERAVSYQEKLLIREPSSLILMSTGATEEYLYLSPSTA